MFRNYRSFLRNRSFCPEHDRRVANRANAERVKIQRFLVTTRVRNNSRWQRSSRYYNILLIEITERHVSQTKWCVIWTRPRLLYIFLKIFFLIALSGNLDGRAGDVHDIIFTILGVDYIPCREIFICKKMKGDNEYNFHPLGCASIDNYPYISRGRFVAELIFKKPVPTKKNSNSWRPPVQLDARWSFENRALP